MSRLDEIFDQVTPTRPISILTTEQKILFNQHDLRVKMLKQEIKDLFLELIGDDEIRPTSGPQKNGIDQGLRRARNKLKAELRNKVKSL